VIGLKGYVGRIWWWQYVGHEIKTI